ncbi:hypothetical protein [Streptomyces sp. NPDC059176]|uniref:hypothetical protein n=1 Tax=unclassified Streptomyces TaxID=2593676 RepID=UPI0036B5AF8A
MNSGTEMRDVVLIASGPVGRTAALHATRAQPKALAGSRAPRLRPVGAGGVPRHP